MFSVVFILVYTGLFISIPIGLRGPGGEASEIIAVNPNLVMSFAESANWTSGDYAPAVAPFYDYTYTLGVNDYRSVTDDSTFLSLSAKQYWLVLWLGDVDPVKFVSENGTDRGVTLYFDDIDEDAANGTAVYSMTFTEAGQSAGTLICWWNETVYSTVANAWAADELQIIHGLGIAEAAVLDIGSLLISLLLFQLPDVPVLINILLAGPIWACIIYIMWFIIKEMTPFLG